jgi:hypothetical protein
MPWPRNTPESFESFVAQHTAGPFYRLSYVREGVDPNSLGKILLGCVHYLVVAAIAAVMVMVIGTVSFARRSMVAELVDHLFQADHAGVKADHSFTIISNRRRR